jgi:hypothetical protein
VAKRTTPTLTPSRPGAGRVEDAVYRDPLVPEYRANPLIEALPPILSPEAARQALAHYPAYDRELRSAPAHLRCHHIQSALSLFVVLPIHLDLERRFSICIRQGLVGRVPSGPAWWKRLRERVDSLGRRPAPQPWSRAVGFGLVGIRCAEE